MRFRQSSALHFLIDLFLTLSSTAVIASVIKFTQGDINGIFRGRMIQEMKLRNFSPATQQSYVYAGSRLAQYHHKSPDQLSQSGLRVGELVNLKIADIDAARMTLRVKQGKGGKDRYAILSQKLLTELRQYWKR